MQGIYIPDNLSLRSAIDVFLSKKTENVWYWMESLRKNIGIKPVYPPPSTWGYNEVHHIDVWYATHPNINPHSHGNPNRKWAATASTRHSVRQGAKASLSTVKDSFLRATGSRPRPARIKITVKAIFLKKKKIEIIVYGYYMIPTSFAWFLHLVFPEFYKFCSGDTLHKPFFNSGIKNFIS